MDAPASEETPDQAAHYIASLTQELAEIARRNGLDTLRHICKWRASKPISSSNARPAGTTRPCCAERA